VHGTIAGSRPGAGRRRVVHASGLECQLSASAPASREPARFTHSIPEPNRPTPRRIGVDALTFLVQRETNPGS
jgi:hypothetical protein